MAEKGLHSGHRDRMRERFSKTGSLEGFAEHEVLEMLMYSLLPRVNTNHTAHYLVKRFGNIKSVLFADVAELCQVDGVGVKCAEQLVFLGKVFQLVERESFYRVQADDFDSLADYLTDFYRSDTCERLCAFSVNSVGKITACSVLSEGVSDRVELDVGELERFIIGNNSDILLLSHNHPDGPSMPSQEDMTLTRQIHNMLSGNIRLMDHVIVGSDGVSSMRALGCFRAFE